MKKVLIILLSLVVLVACGKTTENNEDLLKYEEKAHEEVTYEVETTTDNPVAVMKLADGGTVAIELYPEYAPNTVNNFIYLANEINFYDDLIFHRVIEGFMIQTGAPYSTGIGGPGYSIAGEFTENGFEQNTLLNNKGTIAMARSEDMNSAGSQFYINVADNVELNGKYAVFGKVISGYDKVLEISKVETNASDKPTENVVISSVRVDTKGKTYDNPTEYK